MVGFGIGGGNASPDCDGCDSESAYAFDFNLGGFASSRLALMYDVSGWVDSEDGLTLVLAANTFAGQYWVAPKVWLKGGLGFSQAQFSGDFAPDSEYGVAFTAGAGFEVMQSENFVIDLSGRLNILSFDEPVPTFTVLNFTVGVRWK